jgi:hypothetical protein
MPPKTDNPLTAEYLGQVLYFSYLNRSKILDPRLKTWGKEAWEELPSMAKILWIEIAHDVLEVL